MLGVGGAEAKPSRRRGSYHTIAMNVVTNSIGPHLWKAPRRRDG